MPPEFYLGIVLGILLTLSAFAVLVVLLMITEAYVLLLSVLATMDGPTCSECSGLDCPEGKIKP